MSTGCDVHSDALADLALGRLEAGRTGQVERHLEACQECRDALAVMRMVRGATPPVPEGLETRLQAAVRDAAAVLDLSAGREASGPAAEPERRPRRLPQLRPLRRGDPVIAAGSRRSWALPLAAAAVAAGLWIGFGQGGEPGADTDPATGSPVSTEEYEPYGAWPAGGDVVAGELVLSELSVEELERLLEEMES